MAEENIKIAANQNLETAQKISGDTIQAGSNNEVNTTELQAGSALQTMLNRAQQFQAEQAQNDNVPNNDDNGGGDNTLSVLYPDVTDTELNDITNNLIDFYTTAVKAVMEDETLDAKEFVVDDKNF